MRTETTFELIKEKQFAMNEKLAKVEETEFIIDFVRTEVRKMERSVNERFDANSNYKRHLVLVSVAVSSLLLSFSFLASLLRQLFY